jgi:hypothetical protein
MTSITPKTYLKETLGLKSDIEGAFLQLGERLKKIRDDKLFEGEYQNFDEFLLEAKISKATASKLIKVYETFVIGYRMPVKKLSGVGYTSLYAIAGHASSKERAEELVERASILTRDHLEQSLKEEGGGQARCLHPRGERRTVEVCGACGFRKRVYEKEAGE